MRRQRKHRCPTTRLHETGSSKHFTQHRTVRAIPVLLIIATITQSVYTALYAAEMACRASCYGGTEGLLFPLLAALAGAAMVRSERLTLAFRAIAFAAVLNFIQVGVGLTLFFPFGDAAKADPAPAAPAGAVVAFAFFIYNAAKLLLGFAALLVACRAPRRAASCSAERPRWSAASR